MYYATFDDQGKRITSYVVGLHTDIPSDAVAISDEDQALYATNNYYRDVDGKPVKIPVYVPTLEEEKIKAWESMKTERDAHERLPLDYLDKQFDFDQTASNRLTWAIDAARSALSLGAAFTVDWTCYDNSVVTLTAEQVIGIPIAVALRSSKLHATARGIKDEIDAATTVAEVKAVRWPTA